MSSCPPMQADQKVLYLMPERDRRNAVKEIDVKRGERSGMVSGVCAVWKNGDQIVHGERKKVEPVSRCIARRCCVRH
jgi:hypothetical protein